MFGLRGHQQSGTRRLNGHYQSGRGGEAFRVEYSQEYNFNVGYYLASGDPIEFYGYNGYNVNGAAPSGKAWDISKGHIEIEWRVLNNVVTMQNNTDGQQGTFDYVIAPRRAVTGSATGFYSASWWNTKASAGGGAPSRWSDNPAAVDDFYTDGAKNLYTSYVGTPQPSPQTIQTENRIQFLENGYNEKIQAARGVDLSQWKLNTISLYDTFIFPNVAPVSGTYYNATVFVTIKQMKGRY